jgi:hypothetical protein
MDPQTESRIRDRAYQMWLEDGSPHGKADAYWYKAEQEVLSAEAMDASQVSAREDGPDRDAEKLSPDGDRPTAGEAGPGHPQRPGEKLQPSAPIMASRQARERNAGAPEVPPGDASAGPASSYGASSNAPAEAAAAAAAGDTAKKGRGGARAAGAAKPEAAKGGRKSAGRPEGGSSVTPSGTLAADPDAPAKPRRGRTAADRLS